MNLLQSAQQLSPPTAHYHADFFPPATVDTVNGWLSQIITSAFHAGVQSDLCGSACTSQSSTQIGLFLWPALLLRSQRLWKGDNYSLSQGWLRLGLARITWSSLCNSLSLSEVFLGHINNSRLPWRSHVGTNESSHQKSKVGQLSSSFCTGHLFSTQKRINSLLTAAQLAQLLCLSRRTSIDLTG